MVKRNRAWSSGSVMFRVNYNTVKLQSSTNLLEAHVLAHHWLIFSAT